MLEQDLVDSVVDRVNLQPPGKSREGLQQRGGPSGPPCSHEGYRVAPARAMAQEGCAGEQWAVATGMAQPYLQFSLAVLLGPRSELAQQSPSRAARQSDN